METASGGGRREMKPLLFKAGMVLALSIAGFIISHIRFRLRHPASQPRSASESESGGKGLKDELRILKTQDQDSTSTIINGASTTTMTTTTTTTTFVSLSPTGRNLGDEEGFLLPEFNKLVLKDLEPTPSHTPKQSNSTTSETEQEIAQLKKLVWSLKERERALELELFEYYGLQEQENAVRQLESQLKITEMEAKILSLKIESLRGENQRLQSDYAKAAGELDAARNTVKFLKRKAKTESENAKEKIGALQERISMMHIREDKNEKESVNLRIANSVLEKNSSELKHKLEAYIIDGSESKAMEEAKHLKNTNKKLLEEIQQLQTSRCADVEELVYLRWVNACLRHELRNYKPPSGTTMARDLSKTLSPKSEEKAKQLILQYANSLSSTPADFDTECSSSSSPHTSIAESDYTSSKGHAPTSKSKLLRKLKKLILRRNHHRNESGPVSADRTPMSCSNSERRVSFSTCSIDDMIGRYSDDSVLSLSATELTPDNRVGFKRTTSMESSEGSTRNRDESDIRMADALTRPQATKNLVHRSTPFTD